MSDQENIVVEFAGRIFSDLAAPQDILQARDETWKGPLWTALREAGFPEALTSEACGGAGGSLIDGFDILRYSGRYALAVPLAETMLAGWLLSQAGIVPPPSKLSVAPADPRDTVALDANARLTGRARRVPFAGEVTHLAVLVAGGSGPAVALARVSDCRLSPAATLSGDNAADVLFEGVTPVEMASAPEGFAPDALLRMGAVARCQQIAGTLESMLEISVRYATERVAFGRKISAYQAVQHNLARLGGEAAVAISAARSAADTLATAAEAEDAILLEVAGAKIRCGEAAEVGSAIAHQVHGAIGFTDEHVLHRLTLRALSWRDDFGDEAHWAARLGQAVAARGADGLWPLIASR